MKKIVISGSMKFLSDMEKCKIILNNSGFDTILPDADNWDDIKPDQINEYKRMASKKHFDAISAPETYGILVVNQPKKDNLNYIGANTFAEIAIAFYFDKKIFILNDIYQPFVDELLGWGAIPLKGNLCDLT